MDIYRTQRAPDGAVVSLVDPTRTTEDRAEAEAWAVAESLSGNTRFVVMVDRGTGLWTPCASVRGKVVTPIGGSS